MIRVTVSNLMVLIMVLVVVIKGIKGVRGGDSVFSPSAPVLHHSSPGVFLLLRKLLLCRLGPRCVPLVYKWSSRRWLFGWSNSPTALRGIMGAVSAKGTSPRHCGAMAVAVEASEFSVPSKA